MSNNYGSKKQIDEKMRRKKKYFKRKNLPMKDLIKLMIQKY